MNIVKKIFGTIGKILNKFFLPAYRFGLWFLIGGIGSIVAAVVLNMNMTSSILFLIGAAAAVYGILGMIIGKIRKTIFMWKANRNYAASKAKSTVTSTPQKTTSRSSKSDDTVTLLSAKGEEIEFTEIAGIKYGNNFYAILQPVELLDGMSDDEALVFRVSRGANGEDKFEIELNDNIIDAVFREYDKLYAQAQKRR